MYAIFLECTHCVKKTLTVSCLLLCESGDRVMVDQSSFSADLHAVMLRHQCSQFGVEQESREKEPKVDQRRRVIGEQRRKARSRSEEKSRTGEQRKRAKSRSEEESKH